MKRCTIMLTALAGLALLLAGCARGKNVLVFSETYWQSIMDLDPAVRPTLENDARQYHCSLTQVVVDRSVNYPELLRLRLTDVPRDLVIAGPLLSGDILKMAAQFPRTQFAVLAMPRLEGTIPENVIPVRFKREAAFFEAGQLCGQALGSGRFPELGTKVGVIASGMTAVEKEELAEFERGFSGSLSTGLIVSELIGTVTDRTKAVLAVENLLNQDIKVFMVKTYGLNGASLEKITAAGAYFIIQDFAAFNLFPEKCLLSIEDDYSGALTTLLQTPDFHPAAPLVGAARVRQGVLLTRGTGP
jgi:hypothetical protein